MQDAPPLRCSGEGQFGRRSGFGLPAPAGPPSFAVCVSNAAPTTERPGIRIRSAPARNTFNSRSVLSTIAQQPRKDRLLRAISRPWRISCAWETPASTPTSATAPRARRTNECARLLIVISMPHRLHPRGAGTRRNLRGTNGESVSQGSFSNSETSHWAPAGL
jgi:hypothetical protein